MISFEQPLASPTICMLKCMLFMPGQSKDLGMSYEDSVVYCHSLNAVHPWVGSAIELTALQRMAKEG